MSFAQNLKYLREQARESRKDIANILSVSEMTISRYESGESEPDLQKVVDLAFHFRVTVDDLPARPKEPLFIRNIRFCRKSMELMKRTGSFDRDQEKQFKTLSHVRNRKLCLLSREQV